MEEMKISLKKILISIIIGIITLVAFTMIHLLIVGFDNFGIAYLIIPSIVGTLSASFISYFYQRQRIEMLSKIKIMQDNEARLSEINLNLERVVAERTAELTISNEKLERMNATKDKFFSIVAHDLKNPIWASKQLMDILVNSYNDINDEEKMELFRELQIATNRTYDLLIQLLDWSRSQRGVIDFNPQNVDLNFIAKSNIELLQASAKEKGIQLINNTKQDTFVFADINMITTIIRNLVSNAIKFTNKNGTVKVSSRDSNEYNKIEIIVEDNGIGISSENQDKIFRIDQCFTTLGTNKEIGTGLGLILIKEFVEKHGCRIWVESQENKGSKFIFTMPKEKSESVDEQ